MNKQNILPVDERNKALGIVTINDVEEQFEQLLEYEKSDFIKSHLNCVVEEDNDDELVSKLNLVNLNKDTQLNILKQLDDNVIREFLQK